MRIVTMVVGGIVGASLLSLFQPVLTWFSPHGDVIVMPMPYRIPAAPGMADLRLAMVHDVVTERYVRHGPERDKALRAEAEARIAAAPDDLDAYDDAALAAERLGDNAAARAILERKASRQGLTIPTVLDRALPDAHVTRKLEEPERRRYRTFANLGTVLVHGALPRLLAGDASALPDAKAGLTCLYESVRIDPSAHFGRERWQIAVVEHLLHAAADPAFLCRFDAIGQPFSDIYFGGLVLNEAAWSVYQGKLSSVMGAPGSGLRSPPSQALVDLDARIAASDRQALRRFISHVGADPDWAKAISPAFQPSAEPFDQPVLGILGMWTLGGGASPHFALALATIMENVGQGTLAWECYERSTDLADRFSADPKVREWFLTHVRYRQAKIAHARGGDAWESAMRAGFRAELAAALNERSAFQTAEAERIRAGGQAMDPAADAAYWRSRPPLASPPGAVDEWQVVMVRKGLRQLMYALTGAALGAGLAAFVSALRAPRKNGTPA